MLEQIARDGVQTVLLVDAENLFYGNQRKAARLLRALADWAKVKLDQPMMLRTYGFPKAVGADRSNTKAVMRELGIVHIPNRVKKDEADRHLENDAASIKGSPIDLAIGSGDQDSLQRCFDRLAGGQATIEWVVFNRDSPKFPRNPFGRGRVLEKFPRARTTEITVIFREWVAKQDRLAPVAAGQPWGGVPDELSPVAAESVPWARMRPVTPVFDEEWRSSAAALLVQSGRLALGDARQIASTLQAWLPDAIPEHYQQDFGALTDDAWAFQCVSAVFARALLPGTPASDVEARMLLDHSSHPSELTQAAYQRARALVADRAPCDQSAQLQLLANALARA